MEKLEFGSGDKRKRYEELLPQIKCLLDGEPDMIANMANVAAALKEAFCFLWVGFYRVDGDELVLGPFQGSIACVRIKKGRGVCGTAWAEGRTLVVADVDKFDGHIACSSLSRSEIVVPVFDGDRVVAVLDVDSDELDMFDDVDGKALERICELVKN